MKKVITCFLVGAIGVVMLTGCASYGASPLCSFESEIVASKSNEVAIVAKAFNRTDCKKYLDRNVIAEGYQPIQLYIQNGTNSDYGFSMNRLNLPCAKFEEVADKVHTSNVGRASGYGAASLVCLWFVIPAIVDGIKSSDANTALDLDFSAKAAKDQVIYKHSCFNKIIFVPVGEYQPQMKITLIDMQKSKPKEFEVVIA